MEASYDVIVIGGGSMGIAAAYYVAKSGKRVLVLEQSTIPNNIGSHHGETRIFRMGYGDGGQYVPLLKEALALWKELEKETGRTLFQQVGALSIGYRNSGFVRETIESSRQHRLEHEVLTAEEIERRWPGFHLPGDFKGCFDPVSGFLLSEACVLAYKEAALRHGATILENTRVEVVDEQDDAVHVKAGGRLFRGRKAIVAAGAWSAKLLPELKLPIEVVRKAVGWFQTEGTIYRDHFPCFVVDLPDGESYYGFPDVDGSGVKVGRMDLGDETDPDTIDRAFHGEKDERDLRSFLANFMPKAEGKLLKMGICMFSNTPDHHFIIDTAPGTERVIMAAGFSGHGFKFASVIGDILCELANEGKTKRDIAFLRLERFAKG
ncbi:N-methyl-L-tryptophan oxidase [Halalkalibacter oceani]|uniref:N-methyl-L-tryptophan oxidase n=1 Tax=Halalkalibacter oceani TaxID=1653776 RepID=UPI003390B70D